VLRRQNWGNWWARGNDGAVGKWAGQQLVLRWPGKQQGRQAGKWMGYSYCLRGKRDGETVATRSQEGAGKASVKRG